MRREDTGFAVNYKYIFFMFQIQIVASFIAGICLLWGSFFILAGMITVLKESIKVGYSAEAGSAARSKLNPHMLHTEHLILICYILNT